MPDSSSAPASSSGGTSEESTSQPHSLTPRDVLSSPVQEVLEEDEKALLIRGAVGTGKTELLARRTALLLSDGKASAPEIVVIAGTPSAAQDLSRRIRTLSPEEGATPEATTLSALAANLLRCVADPGGQEGVPSSHSEAFSLYDPETAHELVERCLEQIGRASKRISSRAVWQEIRRVRHLRTTPSAVPTVLSCEREVLEEVFPVYEASLRRAQALDQTAVVARATKLLQEKPDIKDRVHAAWGYVHVDDAQNLTPLEAAFLEHLTGEESQLVLTSDPAQCIRSAFGAGDEAIRDLLEERSSVRRIDLSHRFRPSSTIYQVASACLSAADMGEEIELHDPTAVEDGTEGGENLETGAGDGDSSVRLVEATSEAEEANGIVREVEAIFNETSTEEGIPTDARNGPGSEASPVPARSSEVAILTRSAGLHEPIRQQLQAAGIAFQTASGMLRRTVAQDVLAYLHVVQNPKDDARLLQILNRPSRGIGRTTKERLTQYAREQDISLWEAITEVDKIDSLSSRPRRSLKDFRDFLSPYVDQAPERAPSEWVADYIEESGYLSAATRSSTKEHLEREGWVHQLIGSLTEESSSPDAPSKDAPSGNAPSGNAPSETSRSRTDAPGEGSSAEGSSAEGSDRPLPLSPVDALDFDWAPASGISRFLDQVVLGFERNLNQSASPAVTLATVDEIRGLDFQVVFLAGLEEEIFPVAESLRRDILLADEWRRFYVGMTRARTDVVLSWAQSRSQNGKEEPTVQSRFLETLPADLVSIEQASAPTDRAPADAPEEYRDVDPYYYRDNLRAQQKGDAPDPQPTEDDVEKIRPGLRVRHPKMGEGVVREVEGEGEKRIAVVEFESRGTKKLQLRHAPLEIIAEDSE